MECPKPAWLTGFRRFGFRLAKKISSQPRYDHFDTSAHIIRFLFSNEDSAFQHGEPRYVPLRLSKFSSHLLCSINFDRCCSFCLAFSATGSARQRPHFDTSAHIIRFLFSNEDSALQRGEPRYVLLRCPKFFNTAV